MRAMEYITPQAPRITAKKPSHSADRTHPVQRVTRASLLRGPVTGLVGQIGHGSQIVSRGIEQDPPGPLVAAPELCAAPVAKGEISGEFSWSTF